MLTGNERQLTECRPHAVFAALVGLRANDTDDTGSKENLMCKLHLTKWGTSGGCIIKNKESRMWLWGFQWRNDSWKTFFHYIYIYKQP